MDGKIILVDMEGTLSDSRHRGFFMDCDDPYYWHLQFKNDSPNKAIVDIIENSPHQYMILSAKPTKYKYLYWEWLDKHMTKMPIHVFMRPMDNWETSPRLKESFLTSVREAKFTPVIAIDDREDVCSMFRNNGIQTLHYKNIP